MILVGGCPGNPKSEIGNLKSAVALVDALHAGTLNDVQREMVQALRDGILVLVRHETMTPIAEAPV